MLSRGPTVLLPSLFSGGYVPHILFLTIKISIKMENEIQDNSELEVYFYSLSDTGTIVCVSQDQSLNKSKLNGHDVYTRQEEARIFGLLALCKIDPDTGKPVAVHGSTVGLKPNAKISPAFKFSNTPVLQRGDDPERGLSDGDPTGMFWVTAS